MIDQSKANETHYLMENLAGPDYIHCANRPVQPDEDATRVFDFVECPRCKVKLIGWAIRHIMSLETRI